MRKMTNEQRRALAELAATKYTNTVYPGHISNVVFLDRTKNRLLVKTIRHILEIDAGGDTLYVGGETLPVGESFEVLADCDHIIIKQARKQYRKFKRIADEYLEVDNSGKSDLDIKEVEIDDD